MNPSLTITHLSLCVGWSVVSTTPSAVSTLLRLSRTIHASSVSFSLLFNAWLYRVIVCGLYLGDWGTGCVGIMRGGTGCIGRVGPVKDSLTYYPVNGCIYYSAVANTGPPGQINRNCGLCGCMCRLNLCCAHKLCVFAHTHTHTHTVFPTNETLSSSTTHVTSSHTPNPSSLLSTNLAAPLSPSLPHHTITSPTHHTVASFSSQAPTPHSQPTRHKIPTPLLASVTAVCSLMLPSLILLLILPYFVRWYRSRTHKV